MRNKGVNPLTRKSFNRHNAKAAEDGMFGSLQSRTSGSVLGAFKQCRSFPLMNHPILAFLASWRSRIIGLG